MLDVIFEPYPWLSGLLGKFPLPSLDLRPPHHSWVLVKTSGGALILCKTCRGCATQRLSRNAEPGARLFIQNKAKDESRQERHDRRIYNIWIFKRLQSFAGDILQRKDACRFKGCHVLKIHGRGKRHHLDAAYKVPFLFGFSPRYHNNLPMSARPRFQNNHRPTW